MGEWGAMYLLCVNRGETSRVNLVASGLNINYELRQSRLYKRYFFSKVQKAKVTSFKLPYRQV